MPVQRTTTALTQRLTDRRAALHLNTTATAARIGISGGSYCHIERGTRHLPAMHVRKFAAHLETTVDDLCALTGINPEDVPALDYVPATRASRFAAEPMLTRKLTRPDTTIVRVMHAHPRWNDPAYWMAFYELFGKAA